MSKGQEIDRIVAVKQEFEGARLGDARLERRLGQLAGALAARASESLPEAMGGEAELEAAYRFLGNERVASPEILRPHLKRTYQRCQQQGRVLAVFDTTELRFGGEREELGHLQHGGYGMLAHVGVAVSADGRRDPLGVVHLETLSRPAEKKRRKSAVGESDNERLRWHRGVQAVYKALSSAICVMDREADVFDLTFEMDSRGQSFVVRAAQNRATTEGPLWDLLDDMERVSTRNLEIAARGQHKRKSKRKIYPARQARAATLDVRTRAVVLKSPYACRSTANRPARSLALHLVQVVERNPPDGVEPIEWKLLTNLDVATQEQVNFVVDAYCARWVIEDFFKALKSGCAIEKRQLQSLTAITNILAVSLPIAWLLLRLRNLSRDEPDRPAAELLSPLMLQCLRILYFQRRHRTLPAEPTCKDLAWAIAGLGGHVTNNGEPGFIVLGRGMDRLLIAAELAAGLPLEM
jgi:hypothetical protein